MITRNYCYFKRDDRIVEYSFFRLYIIITTDTYNIIDCRQTLQTKPIPILNDVVFRVLNFEKKTIVFNYFSVYIQRKLLLRTRPILIKFTMCKSINNNIIDRQD